MFSSRHNRRRSINTQSAQVSSESLENRQLLSADGLIGECAAGQGHAVSNDDSNDSQSELSARTERQIRGNQSGMGRQSERTESQPGRSLPDFDSLIELIRATGDSDSAFGGHEDSEADGPGTPVGLSESEALINTLADSDTHDRITDLLTQLRRHQDVQITVEVRFVTVSDQFFEKVGVDFDFDADDFSGEAFDASDRDGIRTGAHSGGLVVVSGDQSPEDLFEEDDISDLDRIFGAGKFEAEVPDFGGFEPEAGMQFGLAILSDIETFFLIQAAQGDSRTNVTIAPKVRMFNGQTDLTN